MDLLSISQVVIYALFATTLVVAGFFDVTKFIIPNILSIILVCLFVVAFFIAPEKQALLSNFGSGALVFLIGAILFRFGVFGGGDVKLWAASALWFGIGSLHLQVAFVGLVGGLLGIVLFTIRLIFRSDRAVALVGLTAPLPRILRMGEAVPYGIAIAIGTILASKHASEFAGLAF